MPSVNSEITDTNIIRKAIAYSYILSLNMINEKTAVVSIKLIDTSLFLKVTFFFFSFFTV